MRDGKTSTTNQITTVQFEETFEPFLQQGLDVLYIGFSSGLSGTFNSSLLAVEELQKKYPDRKIISVDSLAASMGEGLLVYDAVQQKRAGLDIEQLARWVEPSQAWRACLRNCRFVRHHAWN